jgi:hypothetical protein
VSETADFTLRDLVFAIEQLVRPYTRLEQSPQGPDTLRFWYGPANWVDIGPAEWETFRQVPPRPVTPEGVPIYGEVHPAVVAYIRAGLPAEMRERRSILDVSEAGPASGGVTHPGGSQ